MAAAPTSRSLAECPQQSQGPPTGLIRANITAYGYSTFAPICRKTQPRSLRSLRDGMGTAVWRRQASLHGPCNRFLASRFFRLRRSRQARSTVGQLSKKRQHRQLAGSALANRTSHRPLRFSWGDPHRCLNRRIRSPSGSCHLEGISRPSGKRHLHAYGLLARDASCRRPSKLLDADARIDNCGTGCVP